MAETQPVEGPQDDGWRRVSPTALMDFVVVMIRHGILQALPAFAVLAYSAATSDKLELRFVLGLAVLAVLLMLAWSLFSYLRFGYRLRSTRIEVRKGVLHRQVLDVDFDRIQNVSVHEPFYMRPFGMAVIGIDTAGSSGKEIRLPGIALGPAREMRERLVSDARSARLEDSDAPEAIDGQEAAAPRGGAPEVLLQLSRKDVVIAGLTANFMLWAAIAIGTVMGSGDSAESMMAWVAEWLNLRGVAEDLEREGGKLLLAAAVAGATLLALLLLPVISVVGALFRYDGYTLSIDGDRFRRASGLLSRHDDSVRAHKIQAVTWKQNAIALLFERINLQLRQASAGSGLESGQQPGLADLQRSFQVPSLRPAEAEALTGRFLPGCRSDGARLTGVDRRAYMLVNTVFLLGPFSLGMIVAAILVHAGFLILWLVVFVTVVLIAHRCWRQTGWAVAGDHAMFRRGFIGSNTTLFPLFKVQRVDLVQTPLQARRGLAHLTVHLASHSMTIHWMRFEDAERLRDLALYQAENSQEAWF